MKIGMNEILQGIEHSAVQKITKELIKDGFSVTDKYYLQSDNKKVRFDLYAEKGSDRRIYELKIGKNKIQNKQYLALQDAAKSMEARLYIVYLEVPHSKEIEFDGLEQMIYEDLINDLPSEIDCLSTHTTIDSIDNVEIDSINISTDTINVSGSGTININLQFGSNMDLKHGDGIEEGDSMDFHFRLTIDSNKKQITKHYYKIDSEE